MWLRGGFALVTQLTLIEWRLYPGHNMLRRLGHWSPCLSSWGCGFTPGGASWENHRLLPSLNQVLISYSGGVTQAEACHCLYTRFHNTASEIVPGREAGHEQRAPNNLFPREIISFAGKHGEVQNWGHFQEQCRLWWKAFICRTPKI